MPNCKTQECLVGFWKHLRPDLVYGEWLFGYVINYEANKSLKILSNFGTLLVITDHLKIKQTLEVLRENYVKL